MIFSAGLGTRMGALTVSRPKPLVEVAGRPLVDHALDLAESAGIETIVANLHYLAEQLAAHLEPRGVVLSDERENLLETGGGLRHALPFLGDGPVFTLNSDAVWTGANPLEQLRSQWKPDEMDALLLLVSQESALGHSGQGDFILDDAGRLARGPGLVYSGAQIIKTEGLAAITDEVFSLNRLWDRMMDEGRLFGAVHSGGWCDVGDPRGIALAQAMLAGATDV
ncbi:nucleotidyltransferase family protein [Maritimibacter sp. HL-12]|uniref:nucleotidyltransferase family protein n=1 Tax=Maritimibacter sp. HL-12 TaxID=1162418 RepID=UPI0034E8471D